MHTSIHFQQILILHKEIDLKKYHKLSIIAMLALLLSACDENSTNGDSKNASNNTSTSQVELVSNGGVNKSIQVNKTYKYEQDNDAMDLKFITIENSANKYCRLNITDSQFSYNELASLSTNTFLLEGELDTRDAKGNYLNQLPLGKDIEFRLMWDLRVNAGSYITFNVECQTSPLSETSDSKDEVFDPLNDSDINIIAIPQ